MSDEKADQQESETLTESYDTTVPPWLGPPKWLFPRIVYNYGEQERNADEVLEKALGNGNASYQKGDAPYQQFGRAFEKHIDNWVEFRKYCGSFPVFTCEIHDSEVVEVAAAESKKPAKCKYDGSEFLKERYCLPVADACIRETTALMRWAEQRQKEGAAILRKQIQRSYREWPVCKITGREVELHFSLRTHFSVKDAIMVAFFRCPDCHGEKT